MVGSGYHSVHLTINAQPLMERFLLSLYPVRYKDLLKDSYKDLRELLISSPDECAIVYCHSKDTCNDIGARLSKDGLSCRGNVSHIYQISLYGRSYTAVCCFSIYAGTVSEARGIKNILDVQAL